MHRSPLAFVSLFAVSLVALSGCVAQRPLGQASHIANDSAAECAQLCKDAGLQMTALVVMGGAVGCVCQPAGAKPQGNTAAVAGGLLVLRQAEQSSQSQHNGNKY